MGFKRGLKPVMRNAREHHSTRIGATRDFDCSALLRESWAGAGHFSPQPEPFLSLEENPAP